MEGARSTRVLASATARAVLREIVRRGPATRAEIAARIGVTASAVSRISQPLIDAGLVREMPTARDDRPTGRGRHSRPLDIDPDGGQVLGIDISPGFLRVTLANIKCETIAAADVEFEPGEDPDLVFPRVARVGRRLIGRHLDDRSRLLGGGAAITGSVDRVRGQVLEAPCLGWGHTPVRAALTDYLNLPIGVRSLVSATAMTEALFGNARGLANVLVLFCGLGIDAAVILDERLVEGGDFPTGHMGGMKIRRDDGTIATMDDIAGGRGVLKRLHGEDASPLEPLPRMETALSAAIERDRASDRAAQTEMAAAGRELGFVAAQLVRLFRFDSVLISGPLSAASSYVQAVKIAVGEAPELPSVEVAGGVAANPVDGRSAGCGMAICDYLVEQRPDLSTVAL